MMVVGVYFCPDSVLPSVDGIARIVQHRHHALCTRHRRVHRQGVADRDHRSLVGPIRIGQQLTGERNERAKRNGHTKQQRSGADIDGHQPPWEIVRSASRPIGISAGDPRGGTGAEGSGLPVTSSELNKHPEFGDSLQLQPPFCQVEYGVRFEATAQAMDTPLCRVNCEPIHQRPLSPKFRTHA